MFQSPTSCRLQRLMRLGSNSKPFGRTDTGGSSSLWGTEMSAPPVVLRRDVRRFARRITDMRQAACGKPGSRSPTIVRHELVEVGEDEISLVCQITHEGIVEAPSEVARYRVTIRDLSESDAAKSWKPAPIHSRCRQATSVVPRLLADRARRYRVTGFRVQSGGEMLVRYTIHDPCQGRSVERVIELQPVEAAVEA